MSTSKYYQILKLSNLFVLAKTLYHGTSLDKLESIKEKGLVPQVGKLVSDSYFENKLPALVFAADKNTIEDSLKLMIISIGHFLGKERNEVTDEEIKNYGVLIIIYNGDKYFSERPFQNTKEDEDWYLEGGYNYPQVENRDYYTSNTIEPSIILTGNKMISFLRHFKLWPRKTYKNLSLKDKQEIIFRYKFKFDNNRVNLMSEIKSMSEEELDHILYIEGIL